MNGFWKRIRNWFAELQSSSDALTDHSDYSNSLGDPQELETTEINPATGLPMIGGIGAVDVAGNPFGSDLRDSADPFDDDGLSSSSRYHDDSITQDDGSAFDSGTTDSSWNSLTPWD